jgi:murein L,D-transpeptidase YcbB/YkuD
MAAIRNPDTYVENAVKKAQARFGLPPTGFLDKATIEELNVPVSARLRQLRTNLARLMSLAPNIPAGKYIVVNIPSAQIEAINNNQVVSRHTGVVGKPDRPSPLINSAIEEINFNKDWFVPPTVLKSDLVPRGRQLQGKAEDALTEHKIDAYADFHAYQKGLKIDPKSIDWSSDAPLRYFYVQNGGPENPLGFVKLNFQSPHHVYMHDTAAPSIFSQSFRAESSPARAARPSAAAWLLEDNAGPFSRFCVRRRLARSPASRRVPLFWITPRPGNARRGAIPPRHLPARQRAPPLHGLTPPHPHEWRSLAQAFRALMQALNNR